MIKRTLYNNNNAKLITYEQAMARYNLGKNTIINMATKANAIVHIGKCARIVVETMDDFFMTLN